MQTLGYSIFKCYIIKTFYFSKIVKNLKLYFKHLKLKKKKNLIYNYGRDGEFFKTEIHKH